MIKIIIITGLVVILLSTCVTKKTETELIIDERGYIKHSKPMYYNNQNKYNFR